MTSSYRNSRPPWRSPSQSYTSAPERPTTLGTSSNRFLSGSSYRALTGNSALPTRTYGSDSSSVTALKDKFSSIARDKAVLADKRMRVASSGFGNKPTLRTGSASRFGAPIVRSPIKEQSVTVFGVCNVPDIEADTPVDIMVSVVTRSTSPTPPAHSTFLRSKHAGQQEFTMLMVPRKYERGVDVNLQTDERFLRNMPSLKVVSSIPIPRYVGNRSSYHYSKSKDYGSTSDNSGQELDSYLSDSSSHSKSRSSGAETSKLPQPNRNRNRTTEKNREESGISRSPSLSSTAEEKPPTGRKIEEPKLVTIRSIAPVSGIAVISDAPKLQYPLRKMDSSDQAWWLQDSENNNKDPNVCTNTDFDLNMNNTLTKIPSYNIRKMDSSDRNRWLQEADQADNNDVPLSSTESNSYSESTKSNSTSSKSHSYGIRKMDSSDRNLWLKEAVQEDLINEKQKPCAQNISNVGCIKSNTQSSVSPTYNIIRTESSIEGQCLKDIETQGSILYIDSISNPDTHTSHSPLTKNQTYSVRKMDSFDTPWWLTEEKSSCASDESKLSSNKIELRKSDHSQTKSPEMTTSYGVRKMDSFDSPWWLSGDEAKQVNSLSDISIKNQSVEENSNESFPLNSENDVIINPRENQWWLENDLESQLETDLPNLNDNSNIEISDNNYYASTKESDSIDWWKEDKKNTDARSTSISTDWSRDAPESFDEHRNTATDGPIKIMTGVRKMDSFDSPSWLASEESESQSNEPKQTSSGDAVSSSSKQIEELVDSSPDWWGEKNQSDDFVRTKKTSLRIKKIENVGNEIAEIPVNKIQKEPNLQDELDQLMLFIGGCRNIDDLLGNEEPPPAAPTTPPDTDSDDCVEVRPDQVHIHDSTAQMSTIQKKLTTLDDAALQLYKDGDFGSYLDMEASISEQPEEFEGFQNDKRNSIVLRTQLSVKVHTIIDKLMNSEGKELRRCLFALKHIFQEDKDLVHEFIQNDGLRCLIKLGSDVDQNYQNYILRALGQVMLYVDGMNGVIEDNPTIQWLYSLLTSRFRLVVKTALKLLLVFIEYVESNCLIFIQAVLAVHQSNGTPLWSNVMKLLTEPDMVDTELLVYAMTLINKTLNGIPDQDTYYDQVDSIEEQGIEQVIQKYMSKPGTELDLLRQLQIYEVVLQHEDGDNKSTPIRVDHSIRKTLRNRKSLNSSLDSADRRKSRRHSAGNPCVQMPLLMERLDINPPLPKPNKLPHPGESSEGQNGLHPFNLSFCNGDSEVQRESSVKDLTQKLTNLRSPDESPTKLAPPLDDMRGIISKAMEGLAKSQSKNEVVKSPTSDSAIDILSRKTETDLQWERLVSECDRSLQLCDLDFSTLHSDDDSDVLASSSFLGGIPPPPPPCPMLPPMQQHVAKKTKKTVKLFWKEVRDDPIARVKLNSERLLWEELSPVEVDTHKLEHLFESRAKDFITKEKQQEINKTKEVIVLDPKRSNAINIGMTKLPPPRSIKAAILKMDPTVINREGIEKLMTMLPSDEERNKIQEAQSACPDLPLGSAEQFLLTLASVSELPARLKLWSFKLDYENVEKEIAEPLMDLMQGIEILKTNRTFKAILGTLLSVGIFLNGAEVKGFQIEYLAKVPEVKDTVHKHSLLHHLCHIVMDKFPDSTDLYSEIGAITRASRVDFGEIAATLSKVEQECRASFDHLKTISKHDGATAIKSKMSEFLADCAERIVVLGKVHRRVMNRFNKFCLWLGIPLHKVQLTKPNELCRIVSEFSLEYRTTRERVIQQLHKKASHRERNKTRGKMITEVGKIDKQDADTELRQLLDKDPSHNRVFSWRNQCRHSLGNTNGVHMSNDDDELIESLVKTVTATAGANTRTTQRERKRTKDAHRKSLIKRSRTRDNIPRQSSSHSRNSMS
ncbi:FH1/FH2 domain-containing protein 3 isoform X4 [Acyrthosiphon pisum]|uniref:FH1/FH2 domain-containing protein 3 n=1 Tax=Acyrthosiphon pisum TaxID=7029 RepID=A0A8R2B3K1_ACYPI|nr:FH1/FH2 domain-containing protein 3 isoform X4 [Acyrthosiphon pisum]|eukprot:XP_008179653.1 PREDICTED: FH1/FH2 domain-containing protein 3 isoform X4 [Acyrthosiphon pisum]